MKILKRVFCITAVALIIFSILCTSVFAASPFFDDLEDMSRYLYYSPYSNLQSLTIPLVTGGVERFYSFSSPYTILGLNPRDGFDSDDTQVYEYSIGSYLNNNNADVPFNVFSVIDYDTSLAGDYAKYSVDIGDPFVFQNDDSKRFTLHYGQSVLPLSPLDTLFDSRIKQPFWPHYSFELYNFSETDVDAYLIVSVNASLMSFNYGYFETSSRFDFITEPHFQGYNKTFVIDIPWNPEYNPVHLTYLSLYDIIASDLVDYMVDSTSSDILPEYVVFDHIDVTFDFSFHQFSGDDQHDQDLAYASIDLIDFFFEYEDDPQLGFFPSLDDAITFFTENYPVYTLPQSFDDLNFTHFLTSVMSIFDIPLIGEFTLSQLLFGIIGIAAMIWFLKMFAGG